MSSNQQSLAVNKGNQVDPAASGPAITISASFHQQQSLEDKIYDELELAEQANMVRCCIEMLRVIQQNKDRKMSKLIEVVISHGNPELVAVVNAEMAEIKAIDAEIEAGWKKMEAETGLA